MLPTLPELLEKEEIIEEGVIYPFKKGDYEALMRRAINIFEVLQSIQTASPSLNHETTRKRIFISDRLNYIIKMGDKIAHRLRLLEKIVEAEKWAEALFYKPDQIITKETTWEVDKKQELR